MYVMRKIVIIGIVLCMLLSGCASTKTDYVEGSAPPGYMSVVDQTVGYIIYRHDATGVYYLCVRGSEGRAACVMVNADGTPYVK